jgi:hypothetical protein
MPLIETARPPISSSGAVSWRVPDLPVRPGLEGCGLAAADVAIVLGRYAAGLDPKAVASEIATGVLLSKRSAKGRQRILTSVRRRFLESTDPFPSYPHVAAALATISAPLARNQLLLPYLIVSDRGFHDILFRYIGERRRPGARLTKAELMEAVDGLLRAHGQKRWSSSLLKRWSEGVLSVLRDVGALGKGSQRERFLQYAARPEAFAFHLWGLYGAGYRGPALLDAAFWRLLLLREDEIRPTVRTLADRGWWRFTSIAGLDELRPAHESLNDWIAHGLG